MILEEVEVVNHDALELLHLYNWQSPMQRALAA
jgi:hypothetical protein